MIEQVLEFLGNHWMLSSAFLVLLSVFFRYEASRGGKGINCQEAVNLINHNDAVVLDVRAAKDFNGGHITDAINISSERLKGNVGELAKYKDRPIILVCAQGQTVGAAGQLLRAEGYEKLYRLSGGLAAWQGEKLPLVN